MPEWLKTVLLALVEFPKQVQSLRDPVHSQDFAKLDNYSVILSLSTAFICSQILATLGFIGFSLKTAPVYGAVLAVFVVIVVVIFSRITLKKNHLDDVYYIDVQTNWARAIFLPLVYGNFVPIVFVIFLAATSSFQTLSDPISYIESRISFMDGQILLVLALSITSLALTSLTLRNNGEGSISVPYGLLVLVAGSLIYWVEMSLVR